MLPHISEDLSSSFIEKLEGMLQKYRGETVNFDSRKVRKFKGFKFPRPDLICKGWFLPPNTYDCGSFVVN